MSIMDKKLFLTYLNSGNLTIDIIYSYCIEKGKTPEDTKQFLYMVQHIDPFGTILGECMKTAVKYYKDKYNIITISDEQGNIIYNY